MTGGNAAIEPAAPRPAAVLRRRALDLGRLLPDVRGAVRRRRGRGPPPTTTHAARVVVIARELAEKLFGTTDVVGKIDARRRQRHAHRRRDRRLAPDAALLRPQHRRRTARPSSCSCRSRPSRELKLARSGSMDCWDETHRLRGARRAVRVDPVLGRARHRRARRRRIATTSCTTREEQQRAGRFERPPNVRLRDVMRVARRTARSCRATRACRRGSRSASCWCAWSTPSACCSPSSCAASAEIGVRRALGASKRSIFVAAARRGRRDRSGRRRARPRARVARAVGACATSRRPTPTLAQLDLPMLAATFALAIVASLLAGLLPAWRGCQVTPALQLKSH